MYVRWNSSGKNPPVSVLVFNNQIIVDLMQGKADAEQLDTFCRVKIVMVELALMIS